MIEKRGSRWCVVHGPDGKEPEGTIIKCYSMKKFGKTGAHNRAKKMHTAILMSKARAAQRIAKSI